MIFLDFKQLESFVSIAKMKSFSKAAEKLFLTQPTISNHIQALESELGTILFNRTNKNITLTKAGEILYEYAISILNKKETAFFALNEFKGKIDGILEIASSSIPEQYLLVDVIHGFNQKYPDVKYILMKYDTQAVIEKLISGDIDFGIVGARSENNHLEYLDILDDEVILVAPSGGLYTGLNRLSPEDLATLPLIMREVGSGTRESLLRSLETLGIPRETLQVAAEIEDNETIKRFVVKGLGATFISRRAVAKELVTGELKELKVEGLEIRRKFYFVYHKKRVLSPLAETFRSYIIGFGTQGQGN